MKNVVLILTTVIALACSTQKQNDLSNDKAIRAYFNENEIQNLTKIQRFFDKSIGVTDYTNEEEISSKYSDFFKLNSEIGMVSEIKIPFSMGAQNDLNKRLDKAFFNNIWIFKELKSNTTAAIVTTMELNPNGKFVKFIEKQGRQNKKFENYYNTIRVAGGITPSLVFNIAKNFNDYNIRDPQTRLLIAIHYLTINDNVNKK
nr:hypothetical protein [uncultured Draconibacterium sp.]